jgi:hypothetical protein
LPADDLEGPFVQDRATSSHGAKPRNAKLDVSFYSSGEQLRSRAAIAFLILGVVYTNALAVHSQQPTQAAHPPAQTNDRRHFTDEDRGSMREWYELHHDELPLGVRKKDRLPHDLEAQLKVNEVLPENLRSRIYEASSDFLIRVQPAADGCHYVFLGGHAVILERKTDFVYDIYHFEKKK